MMYWNENTLIPHIGGKSYGLNPKKWFNQSLERDTEVASGQWVSTKSSPNKKKYRPHVFMHLCASVLM